MDDYKRQLAAWRKRSASVIRDYKKGVPQVEIAAKYEISRQRVFQIVQREKAREQAAT